MGSPCQWYAWCNALSSYQQLSSVLEQQVWSWPWACSWAVKWCYTHDQLSQAHNGHLSPNLQALTSCSATGYKIKGVNKKLFLLRLFTSLRLFSGSEFPGCGWPTPLDVKYRESSSAVIIIIENCFHDYKGSKGHHTLSAHALITTPS